VMSQLYTLAVLTSMVCLGVSIRHNSSTRFNLP
jgi:hypothetical protein